uniref:P-loop ATPase, Sll1717 family n=1 Tax=Paenarthrobacter nicotinovorans TaxID=29320 RepID=UPI003F4953ED
MASEGIFFAYAGTPSLRAETLRAVITSLGDHGVVASGWESLGIEGQVLITTICEAIDASSAVIADVSTMNSNVLFEAGYALAKNKVLWLALDETDVNASKVWNDLSLLSTVGRSGYKGNSEDLTARILNQRPDLADPKLFDTLLAGATGREASAVFAPALPIKTNAATSLSKMLERDTTLKILGSSDDLGLAPLHFYVREIYRSSAAIFHLLPPTRVRASEHNARASFLAGVAYGLELPLLMVVETGFVPPLDYKDLMFIYPTSAALQEHVKSWLANLPKPSGSNKRLGRLALDIELPIRSFGQYVAEYEVDELNDYFIETSEFKSILEGKAKVFVGRKGTGKSATMTQAVVELRKDRRNLVVPIKPSSYELTGLLELLQRLKTTSSSDYLVSNLWMFLIYTEIAIHTVRAARLKPAGISEGTPARFLEIELENLGVDLDSALADRLEDVVNDLLGQKIDPAEDEKQFIANGIRVHALTNLKRALRTALHEFGRVAVLIDNLDKAWEHGADYKLMSKFLLTLLSTAGKMEKEFLRGDRDNNPVNLTLSVFLRTDIFDVMSSFAREPDKIGQLSVHWQDQELLARVLEERYGAAKVKGKKHNGAQLWHDVFVADVKGTPTRDYMLWRTLPRPRDLIYFANAALTTAINRKHESIQEADIVLAESQYSKFAIEALVVESEAEEFDLEEILYEFAGMDSTLSEEELREALSVVDNPDEVKSWLIKTSFLGIEIADGDFIHVEGDTAARRKLKVAERLSKRSERPVQFRIHPAFRHYLDVRDDDLHAPEIRDTTLVE